MAAQKFGLLPTVFTTLIAPILVSLTVKHMSSEESPAPSTRQESAQKDAVAFTPATATVITPSSAPAIQPESCRYVGQGTGQTEQEALQHAIQDALRCAVAARVDRQVASTHYEAVVATALRNGSHLITHWQEQSASSRWKLTGRVYSKEVIVTLKGETLDQFVSSVRPEQASTAGGGWRTTFIFTFAAPGQ